MSSNQRIQIVPKDPNPLFIKWLEEWLRDAEKKDTMSKYKLKEALNSIRKFPLPLATGRDCAILRGFGPTLCNLIDKKLELYKRKNLHEYETSINHESSIKKIVKECQKRKQQEKLCKNHKIRNLESALTAGTSSQSSLNQVVNKQTESEDDQIIMRSGRVEVIYLVDTQETSGKFKKTLDDTRHFLESQKIKYEIRRLGVGDFCWICRDDQQNELILPYIIERKRMDDFASSIRDGRFHEQKFRLRDSGIQNLIYLIESHGNNQHVGLPMSTLMQAATNTQVHSEFQIKFTDKHRESMFYICTLTKILIKKFKDKLLIGTPKLVLQRTDLKSNIVDLMKFKEFQDGSSKNKQIRVKDVFIKQLLQLKSLSVDKAFAIVEIYPTPRSLISAYKSCSTKEEAEMLLANIPSGKLKRPIGAVISKVMYQFYNTDFSD